jgi:hypothetical protein
MNGATNFSTSCDGQNYWGLELVGADDQITFASKCFQPRFLDIKLQD